MQLEITSIRTDGGTQPRANYHFGAADAYAEDMEAGANFPPVVVFYDGTEYWLADGFHRILAATKIGRMVIDTDVRQGTQQDAQWYSYGVNQTHGLRRSNDDKRRAVEAALRHQYNAGLSDQQIADHCGVSRVYVNQISSQLINVDNLDRPTTRKGRDGKTYNTSNNGKKKPAAPKPEPEDEEPLTPYEQQIAAQYHQNGVTAPIGEPADIGGARLTEMADALVTELSYGDLRRLIDLLAERIAVDV